jgi:hypothetical protein
MRLQKLKALALSLILAIPGSYAASGQGGMTLALNCPDHNTDPKCPNHVSHSQQQDQQRARFEAQKQDQQRTRFEAQKQDHLRDKGPVFANGHGLATDQRRASTGAASVAGNTATKVVPHDDHKSFDVHHKNSDGSQMAGAHRLAPDESKKVTGFKQVENSRDRTTTSIYSDGRRATLERDHEHRTSGSGTHFVTRRDGLREATRPDGRLAFRDRFVSTRDRDGGEHRVIERTRYTHWSHGRLERDERPMVRRYDVGNIYGSPVAQYRPSRFEPAYYRTFHYRFLAPVVIVAAAAATWAVFATPATSYDDPVALMGDMQISSGFEEGYAESMPPEAIPLYDSPDAAEGRNPPVAVPPQAVGNAVPVPISEEVRQQVRQQVRLSVAMHQNGRSMVLSDLLASGYQKIYLFQTAQPINVTSVSANECFLNTGDLIGFSTLPTTGNPFAEMKVVASGANSCRPGEAVRVRLTDLQEMLNGFSERVEDNMKRVSACAASGRC